MRSFIRRSFCKHSYKIDRWHITHGPQGNDPAYIEGFAICQYCGKERYFTAERSDKLGQYIEENLEDRRR